MLKTLQDEFLAGLPLSYILGWSEFYGHHFLVNQHVLIPRPETELMVDLLVKEFAAQPKIQNVLDVGVGSGVILLSLLKAGVGLSGVGVDISAHALSVAQTNSHQLRIAAQFLESDRLFQLKGQFDLIVSNPPYIKSRAHRSLVQNTVDQFEPGLALYLKDEEYQTWFEVFFQQVHSHLSPGGTFMMEGHELELQNQAEILKRLGFSNVIVLQDYSGHDRFLKAQLF